MKCSICNKPIVLVPSAKERAATDVTGKSADYYTRLFTAHADCQLAKRASDTSALIKQSKGKQL